MGDPLGPVVAPLFALWGNYLKDELLVKPQIGRMAVMCLWRSVARASKQGRKRGRRDGVPRQQRAVFDRWLPRWPMSR